VMSFIVHEIGIGVPVRTPLKYLPVK